MLDTVLHCAALICLIVLTLVVSDTYVMVRLRRGRLTRLEHRLMHTLDELVTAVAVLGTKVDALIAMKGALTPDQQAKIDAAFQGISDIAAKVDAVVTPPAPPAPPP